MFDHCLFGRPSFVSSLTVKSVALLLESAKQAQDYRAGGMVHKLLWKSACTIKVEFLCRMGRYM